MQTELLNVMKLLVFYLLCFGYAVNADAGLTRRDGANKHISQLGKALISNEKSNHLESGSRDKRTPQPKPQILLRNLPDEILTKRQFVPFQPDIARHEFEPRREFEQTLLPTPRIIRPLEFESRPLPIERGLLQRAPIDLEHRPFLGQGILNPQLLPHLRQQFVPLEHLHRPLLQDVPHSFPLQPEFEQPGHLVLEPHRPEIPIEGFHRHLLQEPAHALHFQPEMEPRMESTDSLHYGSLGDTPLLELPHRHPLREGLMAPRLIGNLESSHHFEAPQLTEGLHSFQENTEPSISHHFRERIHPEVHHLVDNLESDQAQDPVPSSDDGTDGDDSIETMMNELSKHKKKKAWVTDVNIYDKKNKDEDISKFLDSDDTTDDFNPCTSHLCKNGGLCRPKDNGNYECICKRNFKGKHCSVRSRCFPNPCYNHGKCTETVSGFECSCAIGYKGSRCMERNHCLPNPCLNDGVCNESPESFVCTCGESFQGKSCEVRRTACNPNPCLNNAHCVLDDMHQYKCICMEGFSGQTCNSMTGITENAAQRSDIAVPTASALACINNPCMNNALCQPDATTQRGYKCVCTNEYKGILCEEKTCKCLNNGFCVTDGGQNKCICKPGYAGDNCEKHTQCNEDTCMHGGVCTEGLGFFKCKCDDGYKGDRCETIDRCSPNPCLHGGVCKMNGDTYKCECPNTYKGRQCEDFNFCFPNPCQNGGTCFGYAGGFQCDCPNGFLGKSCENKQYCASSPCKNGGQCVEISNSFKCLCSSGFSGNSCQVRNFCANNPCKNGATCQNKPNSYQCTCTEQFIGEQCETFNHCFETPCKNGGKCEMTANRDIQCTCTIGFTGPRCEQVDECQPNPCQNEGTCLNNPGGGFSCNCKQGYRGLTCLDIDPCHPNPCTHGICSEINGGYVCNCTLGFRGPVCAEIDRCTPNPCLHGASCQEINGGVGYVCQCPVGYKGQICDMKDPCNPSPCQHDSKCLETLTGSGYSCVCSAGWMGDRCESTDPCVPDPCQHAGQCLHDGKSGFKCNCTQGFKGETCGKIDLCSPNPCRFGSHCIQTDEESYQCVKNLCTPNPCKHNGKCIVVNDEGFECACAGGWRGRNCEDYDPCFLTPCLNGGSCTENSNGGFTCLCKKDYQGKYCGESKVKALPEVRWCSSQPCTNGGTCIENNGAYTCRCRLGFSGAICEESVCLPNPCENGGTCVPYYGIALCKCSHDFTGAHCSEKRHVKVKDVTVSKPTVKAPNSQYNQVPTAPHVAQPITSLALAHNPPPTVSVIKKDDACGQISCLHNGMCVVRTDGQPECICGTDFSGPLCGEIGAYGYSSAPKFFPKDECNHCDANAICVNSHCICRQSYVGDGLECWSKTDRDKDWNCDQNPCQNGGTCKYGRARCVCRLGYTGDYCQNYCPPVVHLSFDKMQGALAKDESGNGNDAMLINGAEIIYEGGKCDSGVSLLGGDILFDGERFWPKPVEAVTIALWLKLDTNKGIQSIFDTVGKKFSSHKEGQYHVEIENGKVRWFHRNERHEVVFSIISASLIAEGTWTHIAGTYDAQKSIAKLFLNGDLVAKGPGNGFLSQDWTGKAGIGKHEHPYGNRLLRGMVDEFFIFNCALPRLEVLVLMHHCKLYFGKKKEYSQSKTGSPKPVKPAEVISNLSPPSQSTPKFTSSLPGIERIGSVVDAISKQSQTDHQSGNNFPSPADHWVYTVAEKMHVKGDARAGINRPGKQGKIQQRHPNNPAIRNRNGASQLIPSTYRGSPIFPQARRNIYNNGPHPKNLASKKQPHVWPPGRVISQNPVAKSLPTRPQFPSLLNAAWNMVNAKQKQDAARRKTLEQQAKEVSIIEKMYKSLFGNVQQPGLNNEFNLHNDLALIGNQRSSVMSQANNQINNAGFANQNSLLPSIQKMPRQLPVQTFYPEYTSSESQKKAEINALIRQNPLWVGGNSRSSLPNPKIKKPHYNFAQYTSIPSAMKPKTLTLLPDPSELFYGRQQRKNQIKSPQTRKLPQPKNNYRARNAYQQQIHNMQKAKAVARGNPNHAITPLKNTWPKPNFVEEYATNRGIVRVQSITRPLQNSAKQAVRPVQRSSTQKTNLSYLKDPWSMYALLKKQMASKRQGYQQADSHAATATSSNTLEGATAPGQKGAGHNYGYGYGYGTGDQLKGGGWGQGFGGGGPGENQAGTHHTPDFNNPNMQWSHGQGWGQGGKGVQQQDQYKPSPPTSNFFPQGFGRTQVRHDITNLRPLQNSKNTLQTRQQSIAPKGPSIMNFETPMQSKNQIKPIDNRFVLRGSTPVSSPAYQVKYFASPSNGGYIDESDSARSMRNQIISNAIADALKSIQKKKRTTKGEK